MFIYTLILPIIFILIFYLILLHFLFQVYIIYILFFRLILTFLIKQYILLVYIYNLLSFHLRYVLFQTLFLLKYSFILFLILGNIALVIIKELSISLNLDFTITKTPIKVKRTFTKILSNSQKSSFIYSLLLFSRD